MAFCANLGQAGAMAEWPGWGLRNTALEVVSVGASGWGLVEAKGRQPSEARSARQHRFHLSPSWTGWNDPPVMVAGP